MCEKNKKGFVPIETVASFRRMKKLDQELSVIAAALRTSPKLVVSSDGKRVRRLHLLAQNELKDPKLKPKVSECESIKQAKTPKTKSAQNEAKTPTKNQSQTTGSKTIFVGNLSYRIEHEQVKQFFEEAGEVVDVRLSTFEDGSFKGYGHAEFATAEAAQKALGFANPDLMGRPVWVELALGRGAYTSGSGRHNSSFKSAPRSTVYIEGFDTSIGVDQGT